MNKTAVTKARELALCKNIVLWRFNIEFFVFGNAWRNVWIKPVTICNSWKWRLTYVIPPLVWANILFLPEILFVNLSFRPSVCHKYVQLWRRLKISWYKRSVLWGSVQHMRCNFPLFKVNVTVMSFKFSCQYFFPLL